MTLTIKIDTTEANWLVKMLKTEARNLLEDLSGAESVQISETAIRLLNEDAHMVASLLKKLEEENEQ